MAAKISNWLGTLSHRSHLSGALGITVSVRELIPVAETGEVELIPAELLALGLGLVLAKRLVDD